MNSQEFLRAQAHHFSCADTPWFTAPQGNPPPRRPVVKDYWTGEEIRVPKDRSRWPSNGFTIYRGPSMFDGGPIICLATAFVRPSGNWKTGPMIQTWIMREDMDPQQAVWSGADSSICGDCAHRGEVGQHWDRPYVGKRSEESVITPGLVFKEGGVPSKRKILMPKSVGRSCYVVVSEAPLAKWKSYHRGAYPEVKLEDLPALFHGAFPVRIGSYGDPAAVPIEVWRNVLEHQVSWTGYTSQWRHEENQPYREFLMASVSSPQEMLEAHRLDWRTFRIGRRSEPKVAGTEIICPASPEGGFRTQCDACNLCMGLAKGGKPSIVVAPHGGGTRHHEERGRLLPVIGADDPNVPEEPEDLEILAEDIEDPDGPDEVRENPRRPSIRRFIRRRQ